MKPDKAARVRDRDEVAAPRERIKSSRAKPRRSCEIESQSILAPIRRRECANTYSRVHKCAMRDDGVLVFSIEFE